MDGLNRTKNECKMDTFNMNARKVIELTVRTNIKEKNERRTLGIMEDAYRS